MDRIVPNVGWYPEVVGTPFVPSQYRPDLDLGASIMPKDHIEPEKKEKSRFQRARPPPLQLQREYADGSIRQFHNETCYLCHFPQNTEKWIKGDLSNDFDYQVRDRKFFI